MFADNLLAPGDGVILRFSHPSWENVAGERVPELQVTFSMETTTEFHRWHIPSLTPAERQELIQELASAPHVVASQPGSPG